MAWNSESLQMTLIFYQTHSDKFNFCHGLWLPKEKDMVLGISCSDMESCRKKCAPFLRAAEKPQ